MSDLRKNALLIFILPLGKIIWVTIDLYFNKSLTDCRKVMWKWLIISLSQYFDYVSVRWSKGRSLISWWILNKTLNSAKKNRIKRYLLQWHCWLPLHLLTYFLEKNISHVLPSLGQISFTPPLTTVLNQVLVVTKVSFWFAKSSRFFVVLSSLSSVALPLLSQTFFFLCVHNTAVFLGPGLSALYFPGFQSKFSSLFIL